MHIYLRLIISIRYLNAEKIILLILKYFIIVCIEYCFKIYLILYLLFGLYKYII